MLSPDTTKERASHVPTYFFTVFLEFLNLPPEMICIYNN